MSTDVESGAQPAAPGEEVRSTDPEGEADGEQNARRDELRKAGEKFFNRALEAKEKGADPFTVQAKAEIVDEDVEAFGRAFEGYKSYIYMALYFITASASPILVKGSLYSLQAPAVLMFLHCLSAVGALWLAAYYEVFHLDQITGQGARGTAVSCALWGVQALCIFSSLHHNSVLFVVAWTCVGTELLELGASLLLGAAVPPAPGGLLAVGVGGGTGAGPLAVGSRPAPARAAAGTGKLEPEARTLVSVAAAAFVLELLLDTGNVWLGFLMMSVWTLARAAEIGWRVLKSDPQAGGRITGFWLPGLVRELSDEEASLAAPSAAFLGHALPAVPVLLAGFLALEGREVVNHELSVPAVRLMLLACASYVVAQGTGLLLVGKLEPSTAAALRGAAAIASVFGFFLEEMRTISWLAVLCATVCCGSSLMLAVLRSKR